MLIIRTSKVYGYNASEHVNEHQDLSPPVVVST